MPDEVFAGTEIPSTDHHHHEQQGPLREGMHVYIIIFSSTQRFEFQYMSLSSAMRGVDDAPQLKTLAFQNLVSGCPKGNILHGLLESPTTAQTALLEKLTDEQVQVLQTICASQAAMSVIWSPSGTGKS